MGNPLPSSAAKLLASSLRDGRRPRAPGDHRMTATELAAILGRTPTAVHDWTTGRRRPESDVRDAIERIIGIPRIRWCRTASERRRESDLLRATATTKRAA